MSRSTLGRRPMLVGIVAVVGGALTWSDGAAAAPFSFLQPGFTQEVYSTYPGFLGGVAFAPDGDVLADACAYSGSPLVRFDKQTTTVVNATTVHPQSAGSPLASDAGCGMANHPDGTLYSNTSAGVANLDADTGAELRPPFGPAGNALGIAPDPQTGNLVYVASDSSIAYVDAAFTTSGTLSTVTASNFVDGLYFDASGDFIFLSNRSPSYRLTILRRDGTLVQHVPMTSEPDGIAFHAAAPKFVVTSNTDGTMTRFDFPSDDFTQAPTQSVFASGGFRGDLSQVGGDGCLYLTQDGTNFDDASTSAEDSVVRICPGFSPPVGPCSLAPRDDCRGAGKSKLVVKNDVDDAKDSLIWKLSNAASTSQTEFGDPTDATDYALCVYAGSPAVRVGEALMPADAAKWSAISTKGYKYTDAAATVNGIKKIMLKGSDHDTSKVLLKGKGAGLPDLPLGAIDAPLTVQLVNRNSGLCWGAAYAAGNLGTNTAQQLKAQTP